MRRTADSGVLAESVFYILLQLHQPVHGCAVMKGIAEMANRWVNLGASLPYGALDTLQRKGWIETADKHLSNGKIEYIVTDTEKQFSEEELI